MAALVVYLQNNPGFFFWDTSGTPLKHLWDSQGNLGRSGKPEGDVSVTVVQERVTLPTRWCRSGWCREEWCTQVGVPGPGSTPGVHYPAQATPGVPSPDITHADTPPGYTATEQNFPVKDFPV